MVSVPAALDRYVGTFVAALAGSGVRHAVIAPGSRNTPLTLGLTAETSGIQTWLHLDERSAGYFALGMARQLDEPVAIVCTSGTAAANFLPAVVEARLSRVPLVVLTADRPPELRDVGAAQTIDQVRMFGSHAKWTVDMPVATGESQLDQYAASTAARAAALALDAPAGPVHLNFPFREPLVDDTPAPSIPAMTAIEPADRGVVVPSEATTDRVARLASGRRGLLIAGPESGGLPADAIVALAAALGWPVVGDPLSGLRTGGHDLSRVIDRADVLTREPAFTDRSAPDVVIRFGAAPTSKPLNLWLASLERLDYVVVDEAAGGAAGLRDPDALSSMVVQADPRLLCEALLAVAPSAAPAPWLPSWTDANRAATEALDVAIEDLSEPFEGVAARDLAAALRDGATLVVGNSMPVRDVDSFFPNVPRDVRLLGTRGASGIDGVVSTAVGAAAVGEPIVLLIGDLSFFHDQNGLWPVHRYGLNLTIVLVNNDGGGIFEFLPQQQLVGERFEPWFGTPHGLDFRHVVAQYGGRHALLEGDRLAMVAEAIARPGLDVLELRTERSRNTELHREVFEAARRAIRIGLETAPAPAP
jgi:2-succinyl-5-enolpyruvyl-6-hydroxy-3-cyclohexene-1-carboxylate synthase